MIIVTLDTLENLVEHVNLVQTSVYPVIMEILAPGVTMVSLWKMVNAINIRKHLMDNSVLHKVYQLTTPITVINYHIAASKVELNTNTSVTGEQYAIQSQTQLQLKCSARVLANLLRELK